MKKNKTKKIILAAVMLVLAAVLIYLVIMMDNDGLIHGAGSSPNEPGYLHIRYNNRNYTFNPDLKTILFIGIDNFGEAKSSEVYLNNGQADFLMLAVINEKDKTYSLVHINRDTMTNVQILGLRGKVAGHDVMQIALSHTYGSGLADSCENTVRAVSDLLCGIGVDYYMSMNMDGVAVLNDSVGGVDVVVLDDFEDVPEFKKGETVHLSGDLALKYVRGRMSTSKGSNTSRMERQRQYIDEFLKKYDSINGEDGLLNAIESINEYVVSNMSVNLLSKLGDMLRDYSFSGIITIKGEAKYGEQFMEFYTDEKELMKQVVETFYVRD